MSLGAKPVLAPAIDIAAMTIPVPSRTGAATQDRPAADSWYSVE